MNVDTALHLHIDVTYVTYKCYIIHMLHMMLHMMLDIVLLTLSCCDGCDEQSGNGTRGIVTVHQLKTNDCRS